MSLLKKIWDFLFGHEHSQEELEENANERHTPLVLPGDIAPSGYVPGADEGRPRR